MNGVRWLMFRDSLDCLCEFSVKVSTKYVSLENESHSVIWKTRITPLKTAGEQIGVEAESHCWWFNTHSVFSAWISILFAYLCFPGEYNFLLRQQKKCIKSSKNLRKAWQIEWILMGQTIMAWRQDRRIDMFSSNITSLAIPMTEI